MHSLEPIPNEEWNDVFTERAPERKKIFLTILSMQIFLTLSTLVYIFDKHYDKNQNTMLLLIFIIESLLMKIISRFASNAPFRFALYNVSNFFIMLSIGVFVVPIIRHYILLLLSYCF